MSSTEPGRGRVVLIVEDDDDLRFLLGMALEFAGFAFEVAEDGAAALEVLRKAKTLPCLILLDLRMPRLDGYGFRAVQLADPALASIPVVLCSSEPDLSEHGRALGSVAELRKPFEVSAILSLVGAHGRLAG